jgi:hypothetical protein
MIIPTGSVMLGLPQGYILYDDFNTEQALTENWSVDDPKKICDLTVSSGNLIFDCHNKTKNDLLALIHPSKQFASISGVASLVTVTEAGGPFQLSTDWKCTSETTERAYRLQLSTNQVEAVEYYPLEEWRGNVLGSISVSTGQPHLLQIEVSGGQVVFLVDGSSLLTATPDFPACLSMANWGYRQLVWKDNNRIKGQVDLAGVKP